MKEKKQTILRGFKLQVRNTTENVVFLRKSEVKNMIVVLRQEGSGKMDCISENTVIIPEGFKT